MNKIIFYVCVALSLSLGVLDDSPAFGNQILAHYRGPDGMVTTQSKSNAQIMHQIAKDQGHVTLWLTLNYPFNYYFDELTPEEIAEQEIEVVQGFNEILDPLVEDEDVWHRSAGPYIMGPGIAVRATDKGLRELLKDERLFQVVAIEQYSD